MQVRCQRCGFMFTLGRDAMQAALKELEGAKVRHYNVECPKCRRQVKVPVREMRRFRPRET